MASSGGVLYPNQRTLYYAPALMKLVSTMSFSHTFPEHADHAGMTDVGKCKAKHGDLNC
jgi:hypothetical protein